MIDVTLYTVGLYARFTVSIARTHTQSSSYCSILDGAGVDVDAAARCERVHVASLLLWLAEG